MIFLHCPWNAYNLSCIFFGFQPLQLPRKWDSLVAIYQAHLQEAHLHQVNHHLLIQDRQDPFLAAMVLLQQEEHPLVLKLAVHLLLWEADPLDLIQVSLQVLIHGVVRIWEALDRELLAVLTHLFGYLKQQG